LLPKCVITNKKSQTDKMCVDRYFSVGVAVGFRGSRELQ